MNKKLDVYEADDWTTVYVNGKFVTAAHSITVGNQWEFGKLCEALGVELHVYDIEHENDE